jgi:hypothetical protein
MINHITRIFNKIQIYLLTRFSFIFLRKGSERMKKIFVMMIGILVSSISVTAAIPSFAVQNLNHNTVLLTTGSFEGNLGPRPHGNKTMGTFSGTYELRARGGRFTGDWNLSFQNKSASGTMKGVFARHFIFGRITVAETNKRAPIVGFLRANNETVVGRVMAPVGPALYYWGSYT